MNSQGEIIFEKKTVARNFPINFNVKCQFFKDMWDSCV